MKGLKILLIEDSPSDVQLLRFALDKQGEPYEMLVLEDGEVAVRYVEDHRDGKHDGEPCVILVDLHLPKLGGLDILRAVKNQEALTRIHVVVLSSFTSPEEQAEIHGLGGILRIKPTTLDEYGDLGAEIFSLCKGTEPLTLASV
jgi:CheY-like chemotaxis protein